MTSRNVLSVEQLKVLATILDQKYSGSIGSKYFDVESQMDGEYIAVKVTLRDSKGAFVYPVEARMIAEEQELSVNEARDFLLDYIDAYFEEYLSDNETYLTIDWSEFECDGYDLQMRGQILNTHLEHLADELIAGRPLNLEKLTGKILN